MSDTKTNSFFWLPASAMAALALTSLIAACTSLSADTMIQAPGSSTAPSIQAATAPR